MIVTLPWPDPKLFPNAKRATHWTKYRAAEKADRSTGLALTYEAMNGGVREVRGALKGDAPILMTITFYPPDRRHRDDDGCIGAIKHLRDGIADALGVNDRRFSPQYKFAEPEKPGRVEVQIHGCQHRIARDFATDGRSPFDGATA